MDLVDKIETRTAVVSIIGLGQVGLPLAVAFAEAGFRVMGIDVDESRVRAINRGESYVQDAPSETMARLTSHVPRSMSNVQRANRLSATTDYDALYDVDAAIICVPTPLSKTKDPDMSYIIAATDEVAQRLHRGMLIILESTTYPGTTEELVLPRLEDGYARQQTSGDGQVAEVGRRESAVGRDFFLAFSPERIDPGRKDWTVRNTPKVIGGVTPRCLEVARALYECAIEEVVPVSSPKMAEMVKLLENTFRGVNIALINEMAMMCDRLGIDIWEAIEAAKTKPFGFMPFYPGPGLGGHCIPVDPQYLAWKLKTLNYNARFIQLATEINLAMPQYVLGKIADALNEKGKPLRGSQVLILGVTYKADVGDLRESPALDLMHLLREKGAEVAYHDPYVPRLEVGGLAMAAVTLDREALQKADCVVIATAHNSYDWGWVMENSRLVVDTRNATRSVAANPGRVVKL